MKYKFKVLVAFKEHKIGDIIEMSAEESKGFVDLKFIEQIVDGDNDVEKFKKEFTDNIKSLVTETAKGAVTEVLKNIKPVAGQMQISVVEDEKDKIVKGKGFKHFGHFCYEVHKAKSGLSETMQKYLEAVKAAGTGLVEAVDSDGGFLVPVEHSNTLLTKSQELAIVRPRAMAIPMGTTSIDIPTIDETSRASSTFGGVIIRRGTELGALSESAPKFGKVTLKLTKMYGLCYTSSELLNDSPQSVAALINALFPQAIAFQEDSDFLTGSGGGQPMGILNAACTVSVSKESGQKAATLVFENIIKMYSRLYGNNGVWIANKTCLPQLATMSMNVGTGGVPVFLPANGVAGTPYMTLMGLPLLWSEHCKAVGTVGDIILADLSQYLIGERSGEGLQLATSIHLKFDYDQTAFRFTLRNDGQPWWKGALTPKNGSTLSPFITLATRA